MCAHEESRGSSPLPPELDEVVRRFHRHPGVRSKSHLRLITEAFGDTDWIHGPGDDAAVITGLDANLLVAGEAIWPPFAQEDPFGAGMAAVVANVNDVAAMGGRGLALVNTVVAPQEVARKVLRGLRFAADLYGVSVVGGHLTIREGAVAVSAFIAAKVKSVLSARNVSPGQRLLLACTREGQIRRDFMFFSSLEERASQLRSDISALPEAAESGVCAAAKDVSMAGLLGSLAMLLEATRSGAWIDLEMLPRPEHVSLSDWTEVFPSYAFLLSTETAMVERCRSIFTSRGLLCEEVGRIDSSGILRVRMAAEEAIALDFTSGGPTRIGS